MTAVEFDQWAALITLVEPLERKEAEEARKNSGV
jgi:hypothetical protein